jgi:hypothetical protein
MQLEQRDHEDRKSAMNEADNLAQSLREAALAINAHLVPAALDVGNQLAMPHVSLPPDEFLAFVYAARPRIIYLYEDAFDLEQEVETALEEAGINENAKGAKATGKVAKRFSGHAGETARVFAAAVFDGVCHIVFEAASWVEDFEHEMETITAKEADESAALSQRLQLANSARSRDLAVKLVADPAFSSGRVSFAKRRFLAKELFPHEDGDLLDGVVELAENLHWLASARSSNGTLS